MMDIALVEARRAYEEGEVPVGCVFVAGDGSVLARGRNQTNETLNGTRHCELVCVDEILCTHSADVFKTAELYVTVEPCIMCAAALQLLGVPKIHFGCRNPRFGGCGTVVPVNGVLCPVEINEGNKEEEALGLLKEFYERGNPNCPDAKRQRPL
eukprot:GEMP01098145.1.p1 GENE.GEMP01098145.1~~GEMP01098145.1.p1  ORF type:complete len:154 (+),score=44.18 GEMP01098145.1:273-734(+)